MSATTYTLGISSGEAGGVSPVFAASHQSESELRQLQMNVVEAGGAALTKPSEWSGECPERRRLWRVLSLFGYMGMKPTWKVGQWPDGE